MNRRSGRKQERETENDDGYHEKCLVSLVFCETNRSFFNGKSVNLARNTWAPTTFDNFEKSDCEDTCSSLFLREKGPFFCFLRLSRKKRKGTSETLARDLKKFPQNQRAGLLKRAAKALKQVGLGQSRQVCFS